MAFIQQQRKPTKFYYKPSSDSSSSSEEGEEEIGLLRPRFHSLTISDSDTDWHILSSSSTTSPLLFPSDSKDTEDESVIDQEAFLPSHDGTGTFLLETTSNSSSCGEEEEQELIETTDTIEPCFIPTAADFHSQQIKLYDTPSPPSDIDSDMSVLSIFWNSLSRFKNHLLENDTNTIETISSLMSEAVFEGCIPFGSHVHMEIHDFVNESSKFPI